MHRVTPQRSSHLTLQVSQLAAKTRLPFGSQASPIDVSEASIPTTKDPSVKPIVGQGIILRGLAVDI